VIESEGKSAADERACAADMGRTHVSPVMSDIRQHTVRWVRGGTRDGLYMHIHIDIHVYVHIFRYTCLHIYIHIYVYICIHDDRH